MCNKPASLSSQLDWRAVLRAIGVAATGGENLPCAFECPICPSGVLMISSDPILGGSWAACRSCEFSGDMIELVARKQDIEVNEAATFLSDSGLFRGRPSPQQVDEYLEAYVYYRQRVNEFWEKARQRPVSEMSQGGKHLLIDLGLGTHAWNQRWEEREAQLFGVAEAREVEELFSPLSYQEQSRVNRNGRATTRRGSGPGRRRVFRGDRWGEVLVVPHWDRPGRIIGFTFIGRSGDPRNGDIVYKRLNYGQSNAALKECGVAMLPAAPSGQHGIYGNTVFVFTDIRAAIVLQARHFRSSREPLPIVVVKEDTTEKLLNLPLPLVGRRLVACGPHEHVLPMAKKYDTVLSSCETAAEHILASSSAAQPGLFLSRFSRQTLPWQSALTLAWERLGQEESRLLVSRMGLTPTDRRRLLERPDLSQRLAAIDPIGTGARSVCVRRETVVENEGGWFLSSSEERICNYPLRILFIRTTDTGEMLYEVEVRRPEHPVTLLINSRAVINGDLFSPVNLELRKEEGDELVYQRRRWAKQSLYITQELSQPERIRDAGRVGWTEDRLRLQFPNFSLGLNGRVDAVRSPIFWGDGPTPANDLSTPHHDRFAVEALSGETNENGMIWALAACVAQHLMAKQSRRHEPLGVILDGQYAQETGAIAATSLGCGTVSLASRGRKSYLDYLSEQCGIHDFPTLVRPQPSSRMHILASWLDSPGFRSAIMPVDSVAARAIAIRTGFVRIHQDGFPQMLGPSATAARWILPSYLRDLLSRRKHFCYADNEPVLWQVIDDVAEWFGRCQGNPLAVERAKSLLHFDSLDPAGSLGEILSPLTIQNDIACVHAGDEGLVVGKLPIAATGYGLREKDAELCVLTPKAIDRALSRKRAPALPWHAIDVALKEQVYLLDSYGSHDDPSWVMDPHWLEENVQPGVGQPIWQGA